MRKGKQINIVVQFVKFGLVGVSNTLIAYFTYALICMAGFNFHLGNFMGYIMGTINSFYWNNKYVFKREKEEVRIWWKVLLRSFVSYGFSNLVLTEILLVFWIQMIGVSQYIAPIFNLFVTVPLNFVVHKFWAFKREL